MKRKIKWMNLFGFFLGLVAHCGLWAQNVKNNSVVEPPSLKSESQRERVKIITTKGDIILELYRKEAPLSVENFLRYVKKGFYKGTIFHRVIPGFVIQGGGFDAKMQPKETEAPIKNESHNGLLNEKGTVAMARTQDPHSATSQFFINLANNTFLNAKGDAFGYAVFGRVVEGMNVVEKIAAEKTGQWGVFTNVPLKPIVIENIEILKEK